MATLKLVIVPAKQLSNGTHKVRIAISHKGDTRYIVTRFTIDDEKQFKDGRITNRSDAPINNRKLSALLNDYYDKLDSIDVEYYTCAQIKDILENKKCDISLMSSAFDEYINLLIDKGRIPTAELFKQTKRNFIEFGDMHLNTITPATVSSFAVFLSKKYSSTTTQSMHLNRFRTALNNIINQGIITYALHPFKSFKMPPSKIRHIDQSIHVIRMIRDAEIKSVAISRCRDVFMLSYYLGGMNVADMVRIDFSDMSEVSFERKKTENKKIGDKTISFSIVQEAQDIILRYRDQTGYLKFHKSPNQVDMISTECVMLKKYFGIKNLMFYSARKSFAQHAYDLGVSIETIEYIIGHSMKSNRPVFSYVRVMRKHADEAIRKVIDYLNSDRDIDAEEKVS